MIDAASFRTGALDSSAHLNRRTMVFMPVQKKERLYCQHLNF